MITQVALQRLEDLNKRTTQSPFFLAVGLHKPHIPWVMPQRFLDMQVPVDTIDTAVHDNPPKGYCNASMYICDNIYSGLPWEPASKADQQDHRRKYRAAVSWTDHNIGLILDKLDALGYANNTMIVFHGDHGWHLGEQGGWCKQSNFDLVARVPLIVYVPWIKQSHGTRTSALVETVDLMPTTLDLMGLTHLVHDFDELEGTSFLPLLQQPTMDHSNWKNATFTQYPRCKSTKTGQMPWEYPSDSACTNVQSSQFDAMGFTIRVDRWRYTLWLKWDGANLKPIPSAEVGEELYDHQGDAGEDTDAFENENLAAQSEYAGIKAQLRVALVAGWKPARPVARQH